MDAVAVHGRAGAAIELPVGRGPATGYDWVLDLPAGVVQAADGPGVALPPGRVAGGASGAALRVSAAPGHYHIVARLIRPWQPDAPAKVVEIDLSVE